jgi:hypothetical protein
MLRHRRRRASDISGCDVDTCEGPFDAAATFWFLFATLRDTIGEPVRATTERKAGSPYHDPPLLAIGTICSRLVV